MGPGDGGDEDLCLSDVLAVAGIRLGSLEGSRFFSTVLISAVEGSNRWSDTPTPTLLLTPAPLRLTAFTLLVALRFISISLSPHTFLFSKVS